MGNYTLIAPLRDFQISVQTPVKLTENISLEPISHIVIQLMKKAIDERLIRNPFKPSSCLIVRDVEGVREDASDLREEVEEAILRLRLYKPGGVGCGFILVDQNGWYDNPPKDPQSQIQYVMLAMLFYDVWEREGMQSLYTIEETDIEPLKTLFTMAKGIGLLKKPSFRYFYRSYHEPYATDRFLSNSIGLENLLINEKGDRSNYRYKFSDRGSYLLQLASPRTDGPEIYYKDLRDIYDGRSEVVHSNEQSEWDWHKPSDIKRLQDSETYLRELLLYIIKHPELGDSQIVDVEKRKRYI